MNTKSLSSSSRTLVGKCLCGAVQVSIADEFLYAGYCHCPDCRASSGSAFSAFAGIRKDKLQLRCDEESISKFRKNEDNVIHFCRHCGSWLFSIVRDGEFAHVRLGRIPKSFGVFFSTLFGVWMQRKPLVRVSLFR